MNNMKAAVPVLPVRDTQKALQFYAEKLRFREVHCEVGYAIAAKDNIEIHLWAATDERWKERDSNKPVVSGAETFIAGTASCRVHVDDIDSLYEIYQQAQVIHPNGNLSDKPYGLREFAVLDMDGNLITFFQRAPA